MNPFRSKHNCQDCGVYIDAKLFRRRARCTECNCLYVLKLKDERTKRQALYRNNLSDDSKYLSRPQNESSLPRDQIIKSQ